MRSAPASVAAAHAAHDLDHDESAGGHTLRKHVGLSDDDLRDRLQHDHHITAASTYTDRETAEHAVAAAISQSGHKIERWLARVGGHPNLVLDYDSPQPIGRTMVRGEGRAVACSHAVAVLKWAGPSNYYVLTSYPECH